jgi:gas vesicle protein
MVFDDGDEFVLGVLVGALIGAGVALLLAPESGKRTRRRIRRSAEDLTDAAGDTLQTPSARVSVWSTRWSEAPSGCGFAPRRRDQIAGQQSARSNSRPAVSEIGANHEEVTAPAESGVPT